MIRQNSFKAWVLAARPKTLTGAAVPVMVGASLAWQDGGSQFQWLAAVLCFLFAFVMQIDANFVNDYFDFRHGNDDETRLGPKRACAEGWVTPHAMVVAIALTTMVACAIGLPLIYYGGWEMVIVGAACVVFCFLYTTCLSYLGLGDVLVLVFFGLVPVCCTYWVCLPEALQTISPQAVNDAIACGLVIDTLLIVNNFRDHDNDLRAGKRTLIVLIGKAWGCRLYLLCGATAALIVLVGDFFLTPNAYSLQGPVILVCYGGAHYKAWRLLKQRWEGSILNTSLADTSINMMRFGLCYVLSVILCTLFLNS